MFSKCHGKCQQSPNRWPTDICPCLVSQPPVSPDLRRGAEGPSPVLATSLFLLLYFHTCGPKIYDVSNRQLPLLRISRSLISLLPGAKQTLHCARVICKLKTQARFYLLRPALLEQICCQRRLESCLAEWMHEESWCCPVVRHDGTKRCGKTNEV